MKLKLSITPMPVVMFTWAFCSALAQTPPPAMDPRVEKIVSEISPDRIRATIERLAGFGTRHTLSDTTDPLHGIGAARRWVKSEFDRYAAASGGRLTTTFDEFSIGPSARILQTTAVANVVATLHPAGAYDTTGGAIVICAHLDSRSADVLDARADAPGADDDGSGVALVLEIARVLSNADVHVPVVFLCCTGEEQGLFGSRRWAELAARQGMKITAVLNNDIVGGTHGGDGRSDSTSVRLFSAAFSPRDTGSILSRSTAQGLENDGRSRSLARYCKEIGELYVPGFSARMVYRPDRFLRGGDQTPFHERGFAAVRFSESVENFDHQHQAIRVEQGRQLGDLPEFVDAGYCANIARMNAAVAATLAFAPPPPGHPAVITSSLSYDTQLRWDRSQGTDAAGYYVRWRETTSPVWQFTAFTADTTLTLHVNKDDFLFGIQAVNRAGNTSLFALPAPAR